MQPEGIWTQYGECLWRTTTCGMLILFHHRRPLPPQAWKGEDYRFMGDFVLHHGQAAGYIHTKLGRDDQANFNAHLINE